MIGPQQVNMGFLLSKINCIIVQQKSSPGRIFFIRNLNEKKTLEFGMLVSFSLFIHVTSGK
jgi:hypothetical protein